MKAIEVRDLYYDYNGVRALNGVNLSVEEGEKVAILGPTARVKRHFCSAYATCLRERELRVA